MFSDAFFSRREHTTSQFNSVGPTLDGRMKPDLLASGYYLMSAYSSPVVEQLKAQRIQYGSTVGERVKRWADIVNHNKSGKCAVHEKSGSSMATPVVSASALLVREYFLNPAFWLTVCREQHSGIGMCSTGEVFEPSGYLTKGLLLHSAQRVPLVGDRDIYGLMGGPAPSAGQADGCNQGYGEINLANVLPLPLAHHNATFLSAPDLKLVVFDSLPLRELSTVRLEVEVSMPVTKSGREEAFLHVTLCWYDPPSAASFAPSLLIHDIDLLILGPYTSSPESPPVQHAEFRPHWGNSIVGGDHKNPNERILVTLPRRKSNHIADNEVYTYHVYLISHAFPLSRHRQNADGSTTIKAVGVQNVAISMTSSAALFAGEFEPSLIRPSDSTPAAPLTVEPDPPTSADHRHNRVSSDLPPKGQSTGGGRPDGVFLDERFITHDLSFQDVPLGIYQVEREGVAVFGSFENDVRTLGVVRPPPPPHGQVHMLAGLSVCLTPPRAEGGASGEGVGLYSLPRRAGVDAYLLSLTVSAPGGGAVQLGGYDWVQRAEANFYRHYWPFLWMSPEFDSRRDVDMHDVYCRGSEGSNGDVMRGSFAAYRDVSLARLVQRQISGSTSSSGVGSCAPGDCPGAWTIQAAYGIQPYGTTPIISFSGEIRLYFLAVDINSSTAAVGIDPFLPPPQPSRRSSFSFHERLFSCAVVIMCLVALVALALRINKLMCHQRDTLSSLDGQEFHDHRTPLSQSPRTQHVGTSHSCSCREHEAELGMTQSQLWHRPLQYGTHSGQAARNKIPQESQCSRWQAEAVNADETRGLLSAESYAHMTPREESRPPDSRGGIFFVQQ